MNTSTVIPGNLVPEAKEPVESPKLTGRFSDYLKHEPMPNLYKQRLMEYRGNQSEFGELIAPTAGESDEYSIS